MIAGAIPVMRVVINEGEGSLALDEVRRFELMRGLLEKGYAVTSTRSGGQVSGVGEHGGMMVVLGQFNQEGFADAQGMAGNLKLHFCDIDGMDLAAIVSAVEAARGETADSKPSKWKPWFPVIDYKRCT